MSEGPVLHLFGGKGGVGKSTLASAFALNLSEANPKESILLASMEESQGLSDVWKRKLGGKPTRILVGKGEGGLSAQVFEAVQVRPRLEQIRGALAAAAPKGLVLGEEDLGRLVAEVTPGLEPLLGLLELAEQVERRAVDRLVVDGASTSMFLRILDLAPLLRRACQLARGERPSARPAKKEPPAPPGDGPLDQLLAELDRLQALLRDPARTALHLITLAEPVVEAQTRFFFAQARERGLPVAEIVVNGVEQKGGCPACQGRRGLQAPHVRKYQSLDKALAVHLLGRREEPPRGVDELRVFAKEWASHKETKALEFSAAEGPPALVKAPSMPPIAAPPLPPTRLIFFVGQGGVGKSSCAAAAAVTLTEKEGPVLLISVDAAHSLSDVLQSRLTDTETQVKGTKGLYARELDVAGWFAGLRKRWRERSEKAFEAFGKQEAPDREALRNLLDVAPAGLEDLAAFSVLTDALVQERFKRIVVDPAPAAAAVRLVELPERARGWLTALLAVLVKHRARGLGELADEVAALLKHVKRFEDALVNPAEARFVVVTRGEDLAASRTERLVEVLREKRLAVDRVLVNRVLPKSNCPTCENRRRLELGVAKALEKKIGLPVTVAPALGRHPAGLRELKSFRTAWYALSATQAKPRAA
ncbi:MAG TPA: TRC40/GET3/ArsA family transport-energizing ATPase [Myxococcaceae bacterium]|jgi:arsenite-transporting ATPase|nr:TRC40/GET3/ArsA family transport-energizing ATPase [Myxococcaceae bacterium]